MTAPRPDPSHLAQLFDWRTQSAVGETDATSVENWRDGAPHAKFAWHQDGWFVFLSADRLDALDEYHSGDPYSVGTVLSPFNEWRLRSTVSLVDGRLTGSLAPRLLDLGCGEGHFTLKLKEHFPGLVVAGLDASISAIRTAARLYPSNLWVVGDAYDPPFREGSFDIVVCNNLWEHVPDPIRLVRGAIRSLRLGGYVVVSTPSRYRVANLLRVLRGRTTHFMSASHVTEYTVGQVKELLRFAGLEVISDTRLVPPPEETWRRRLLRSPLRAWKHLTGSHHVFEGTTFAVARKVSG